MPMVEADGNGGAKAQNLLEKSLGKVIEGVDPSQILKFWI